MTDHENSAPKVAPDPSEAECREIARLLRSPASPVPHVVTAAMVAAGTRIYMEHEADAGQNSDEWNARVVRAVLTAALAAAPPVTVPVVEASR